MKSNNYLRYPRTLRAFSIGTLVFLFTSLGCVSQTQLTKLQNEKQQLTALVAQEKQRTSALLNEIESLNSRAAEAERELALLHEGRPTTSNALAALRKSASPAPHFELWAKTHEPLKYDPVRRLAYAAIDPSFTSDERLSFQTRRDLDTVADLLLTPEARRVAVRIAHYPASGQETQSQKRANAVLDYLQQRGIAHQRLEVVARPPAAHVDEDGRKTSTAAARLELELSEGTPANNSAVAQENNKEGDGWVASPQRRR